MLAAGILAGILWILFPQGDSLSRSYQIGWAFSVFISLGLSFRILAKKNQLNNVFYIFIALLSGVLAILMGGLLGLIPAAFLSTRKSVQ